MKWWCSSDSLMMFFSLTDRDGAPGGVSVLSLPLLAYPLFSNAILRFKAANIELRTLTRASAPKFTSPNVGGLVRDALPSSNGASEADGPPGACVRRGDMKLPMKVASFLAEAGVGEGGPSRTSCSFSSLMCSRSSASMGNGESPRTRRGGSPSDAAVGTFDGMMAVERSFWSRWDSDETRDLGGNGQGGWEDSCNAA